MKLYKPNAISVCFVGGDLSLTKSQELNLDSLKDTYSVEFLHRGHKFSGSYPSFSQIINEFVVESENEFMVFINPKVSPEPYQVEDLINKLCLGYCWVSRINFGFWATTKELFRNIGLMDERFIGSEWEDNDFLLRLKLFRKAIFWEYKTDEYEQISSPYFGNRGLSKNFFRMKWIESADVVYLNSHFSEEKKLPLKIRCDKRLDIYDSWSDCDKSVILGYHGVSEHYNKNVLKLDTNCSKFYKEATILISADQSKNRVEFLCDEFTTIDVFFQNSIDGKLNCWSKSLNSNTWNSDSFFDSHEDIIEVKIFHDSEKIYHNKYLKLPFDFRLNIGLRINKYH